MPFGKFISLNASPKQLTIACEDLKLSLPLLNTTALPDLILRALASADTFGLLSKIIPMVPSGVLTLEISRPFGRFHVSRIVPTGSGSLTILFRVSMIPSIRSSSRRSLSTKASSFEFESASSTSRLLANRISFLD